MCDIYAHISINRFCVHNSWWHQMRVYFCRISLYDFNSCACFYFIHLAIPSTLCNVLVVRVFMKVSRTKEWEESAWVVGELLCLALFNSKVMQKKRFYMNLRQSIVSTIVVSDYYDDSLHCFAKIWFKVLKLSIANLSRKLPAALQLKSFSLP